MSKGSETKQVILNRGFDMASRLGLESLTIGELAKATGMSKSGLFAHFNSKENLQAAVLEYAAELFAGEVIEPALGVERGLARIEALVDNWVAWTDRLTGGCVFVTACTEYADRPGRMRELLVRQQEQWLDCLRRVARSAIKAGHFREDVDCDQFAFDLYSAMLGYHLYRTLLGDSASRELEKNALKRLLAHYTK